MSAYAQDWSAIVTAVSRQPKREYVDFARVPPSQWKMHDRLEGWARWCRSRTGSTTAPMFRFHTSDKWVDRTTYGSETVVPVDKDDAVRIAKGVAHLPDKHRRALSWCYVSGRNPSATARELGLSLAGLAQMVLDARQMLVNRGV